jgi:hypothetical protein
LGYIKLKDDHKSGVEMKLGFGEEVSTKRKLTNKANTNLE